MPRSHPPTLLTLAERALRDDCRVGRGTRILVAVSGGGDSSALLSVLGRLAPRLGVELVAHGVDHGLRAEAARELDLAEAFSRALGVPFARTRVEVARGGNLQARARAARRQALEVARVSNDAAVIATAHHADDRAETVLIRLIHGARPEALAVLGPRDGRWIRPFYRARKSDVLAHLERHQVSFAEDPSNRDPRFLRVRVRSELLPLLMELSPRIVEHLGALADELDEGGASASPGAGPAAAPLRRAHVDALRRALRLGRGARIRMPTGRELVLTPPGARKLPSTSRPPRELGTNRPTSQKGGAKTPKSG